MVADNDEVVIDWSTATVKVNGQTLQLEVDLEPEPSHFWTAAFNELRSRRTRELKHDWLVNAPSHRHLTVGGVKPGSEEEVREGLEEMVGIANRQAPLDWEAHLDQQEVLQEEARARESDAGEMTERFRTGLPD